MSYPIRSRIAGAAWGALLGLTITIGTCIALGMTLGMMAVIANPNDPSAGSVAEIGALAIPLLTPLGVILGGVIGWVRAARRSRAKASLHPDA